MREVTHAGVSSWVTAVLLGMALLWLAVHPITLHAQELSTEASISTNTSVNTNTATSTPKRTFLDRIKAERVQVQEKTQNLKENRVERVGAIKAKVEERRADMRNRFEANVESRLRLHTAKIMARFNAAVDRLEGIGNRIDSRIEKFSAAGVNVTEAQRLRDVSKIKVGEAKVKISALPGALEAQFASSTPATPGQAMGQIRTLVQDTQNSLKAAHQSLVDIIVSLKKAGGQVNATTTTKVKVNTQ